MKNLSSRFVLLLVCHISASLKVTAQSSIPFEPIGNYTWVKKSIIHSAEKLPCTVHQRKAIVRTEPRKEKQLYQRHASCFIQQLPQPFTMPGALKLQFTGKKLSPVKKIRASPFYYKDKSLFDIVYSDKAHGFYSDNVQAIAEDNEKNMWIASSEGLIRFDGLNYYIYTRESGLASDAIHHVVNEPATGIWISTANGFQLIRNDSVFNPIIKGIIPNDLEVYKINIDNRKNLWINTLNRGALKLDRELKTAQHFDTACGLRSNIVRCSVLDKNGQYWFAGNGMITVKGNTINEWHTGKKYFNDDECHVLLEDADTLWVGTFDNGVFGISPADTTQISTYPTFGGRVFDLIKQDGILWFTLYGGGLVYKAGNDYGVFNEANGLSSNLAYALLKDSYGNIWVSTPDAGMSRLHRSGLVTDFHAPDFLHNAEIIKKDSEGNRWYFLNGGGLWKETSQGYEYITNEAEKPVPSVRHFMDGVLNADGTAWLASYSYGIAYYDKKQFTFYYYADEPAKRVVLSATTDGLNRPWFGTLNFGLIYVQDNVFYHLTTADGLASNRMAKVTRTKDGSILCLSESGIQKISNDTLYDLHVNHKPFTFSPHYFHTTTTGDLLLASDTGLLLMQQNRMYVLAANVLLHPSSISTILEDSNFTFWFKNETGIVKAQLQNTSLTNVYALKTNNKKMLTRMYASGYVDENNSPHWSSDFGMITFKPAFESMGVPVPLFHVIETTLDGATISNHQIPEIFPENKLTITYSTLCWGSENILRQSYLLIRANSNDTLVYQSTEDGVIEVSNLPVGEYQLLLAADLYQQTYYSKPITIQVKPHWYSSGWFYLLCSGIVALAIERLYKYRTKRLQKSKQKLEATVASRTADLKESLSEKELLLKEIHHRVKNNLQVVSGLLDLQQEEITDEKAKAIFRQAQSRMRAMELIHHNLYKHDNLTGIFFKAFVEDLAAQMAAVFGDKATGFTLNLTGEDPNFDIDTAVPLGLVLNELLTNAYKYAIPQSGTTLVNLDLHKTAKGQYQLIYRDNGPGIKGNINFESANTLGLRLIKGLIQQVGGSVNYHYDAGAVFTFFFKDTETRKNE